MIVIQIMLTRKLLPGMMLANDVFFFFFNIRLLDKGTVLSEKDIARLAFYSIIDVLIEENPVETKASQDAGNSGLTYSERLKQSEEFKEFKHDLFDLLFPTNVIFLY